MTSIAAKTATKSTSIIVVSTSLLVLLHRVQSAILNWFGAAARTHDRRHASQAIAADTMRDTGMDPETASGRQVWQADLPFFMQQGFGAR